MYNANLLTTFNMCIQEYSRYASVKLLFKNDSQS